MTSLIVALALGQSLNLNNTPVRQGRGFDGGTEWGVYCTNCTGGGGSGGAVTQGTGSDGGTWWNVKAVLLNASNVETGTFQTPLQTQSYGDLDSFSSTVTSSRYNQVEIDYSTTAPASITDLTVTTVSTGSSSNSGGQAVFSTGTGTTGAVKAVTNLSVSYRPHAELYAAFTAIYTTGVASSYQRVGIYDSNNGFFLGYEGTSFGLTIRKAGVDTFTAKTSWNLDTLTGAAGSKYTRNGTPEAIDVTKDNLYRVRFGWLGAAPVVFEVLSPDGRWVAFHVYRHPNTVAATSINSPNLPMTLDVAKTAGATNLVVSTACWAAGSTSPLAKVTSTITDNTLAQLGRSVITGQTTGGGGGYVNVKVNPSGALATEVTQASQPWLVAGADGGVLNTRLTKVVANPITTAVSCATTATALPSSALAGRTSLCVYNAGAATVYLGGSTVTTASGLPLPVGAYWCDDVQSLAHYCIVATGNESVRVLEN